MAKPRSSMREVAARAGVALASVSRVLSGHPDVSPAMRDRVMTAVRELNYEPDLLAGSLRRRHSLSVGFVVGDISNPLLAEIVLGAETELREGGYSMLLTNSENDPELDARHIHLLQQRRVDGLLLSLASEDDPGTLAAVRDFDGAAVVLDRELADGVAVSSVLSDHRSGMKDAVGHLLDLGHRSIGLILGQPLRYSRERRRGLEEAFASRGLEPTYRILEGRLSPQHGRMAMSELLASEPPTAVIAGGNQLVLGVLDELHRREIRVGAEISLISCDTISVTELHEPPIAVVERDTRELGRRAAALLLRQLGGQTEPQRIVLPTAFVPRPSCGPPN
jgi:LacI family transcriptional regulator